MLFKILVVDDEKQIETLFRFYFRKSEQLNVCQIYFVTSGVEAIELIEKESDLNLILTDINMPEMDGFELVEKIKERNLTTPIYMISAYDSKEFIERSNKLGVDHFFAKPLNFRLLKDTIMKNFNLQLY